MDGFSFALSVVVILLGVYDLFLAVTGSTTPTNLLGRLLRSKRVAEQPRAFFLLNAGALIALGASMALVSLYPSIPRWPSLVAMVAVAGLGIAAHLQRSDV